MITVVVVDDDFRVARIHRSLIERIEGFAVVGVAHSGAEALRVVTDQRPDLLLLDLYLPDVFGLDLLNQLRVQGVQPDVLVISAANESDTVQRAVQLGVVNYLLKPFTFADLQQRLADYSAQRAARRPERLGGQAEVDRLLGHPGGAETLPKGMSRETADQVWAAVRSADRALSAQECADLVGVSRVSARRYLEHFAARGWMTVALRYGSAGRPERRYRVADAGSARARGR